jgi:hypothetical protein
LINISTGYQQIEEYQQNQQPLRMVLDKIWQILEVKKAQT